MTQIASLVTRTKSRCQGLQPLLHHVLLASACVAGLLLNVAARAASADQALIQHGKYLATAGDCVACHTAPGGKPFAGGLYMNTPFGPISTANITPDRATGIGDITDDQFVRVFHQGIGMKGERLYPVMPYPWYTKVTRDDALAIKAYLFSLPAENAPRKPLKMVFPFNIRASLIGWDAVLLKAGEFKPDPNKSAQVNRGAYLVQGLAHCGECHNGHSVLGDSEMADRLSGGPIDQWYAPNITSSRSEGIGRFTDQQIFIYLKTGREHDMGVVVGPMAQTMHESLGKLTDDDLHAIVAYLKSTPAKESFRKREPIAGNQQVAVNAQSYLNYCAACHGQKGEGIAGAIPKLAGNGAVTAKGPETVIRVVLGGIEAQGSYAPMPAIGARMSDQEVADAVNYARAAWGNAAPAVAGPGQVGALRKATQSVLAANAPDGCPKIAEPAIQAALARPDAQKLLAGTSDENMSENARSLISMAKVAEPGARQADIINALTLGYCPVVMANKAASSQGQRALMIDEFSEGIYTEIMARTQERASSR